MTPLEGDADEINIDQLNHAELKAKLKQMNVKTRIKNVDRLRQPISQTDIFMQLNNPYKSATQRGLDF